MKRGEGAFCHLSVSYSSTAGEGEVRAHPPLPIGRT